MQYRLIALDLDGTLLSSRKQITPRTREALLAARARGIALVIATGRTAQSARYYSQQLGGGPIICCNGGAVLDQNGHSLATKPIPLEPLRHCLGLCKEAGVLVECYTDRGIILDSPLLHMGAYFRWVRPKLDWTGAVASLLRVWHTNRVLPVPSLLKWAQKPQRAPVLKVMVVARPEILAPLAQRLQADVPGLAVTSSGHDNLEIMAAGVSKGWGLAQLGARLQIPNQAMISFGDSDNDLEMLQYAGVGVAMGNAHASVQATANRVTATCDQDGVAHVIEELCLS